MRLIRRLIAAAAIAVLLLFTVVQPASAAMPWPWQLEGTWYKTRATCTSRGIALVATGLYVDYSCRIDEFSDPKRMSLWVLPRAGGGTGIGGWAFHNGSKSAIPSPH